MHDSSATEHASAGEVSGGQPGVRTLLGCFLRTYMVGAAFNTRGMQNVGLIFAMEPGLRAVYPDARARQRARKRYLSHYNTHMFWTPLLVGIFLSLEDKISRGLFPPQVLESVKNTTVYTLSAIGDSVFGGTLLVFWSLSTVAMYLTGLESLALVWAVVWFAALHVFKLGTFIVGYREGLKFLTRLKRWNLINWGRRLKMVNAALLSVVLYLVWPAPQFPLLWVGAVAVLLVWSVTVSRFRLSRELVAVLVLAFFAALPWL
jgi:PTS system mannose-specific IID component